MIQRIAIVGAGVNGLSCGIRLREAGAHVTLFAEHVSPDTTSDRAGAVFSPFRIEGHPAAAKWTAVSYHIFCQIAADNSFESGVSLAPMREYFFELQEQRPWWADIVQGFRRLKDVPKPYVDCVAAIVPRMGMRRYMPWLSARLESAGGTIVRQRMESFAELFDAGFDTVVNCSGVGAARLAGDPAVQPMRGQVLHIENNWSLNECLLEEGRGSTTTYVFPFSDYVVLGGTYEAGMDTVETDEAALAGILNRCQSLVLAAGLQGVDLRAAARLRALGGLRPARIIEKCNEAIRLEREEVMPGKWVVHNYGHGRAGVTFSWGCASAVADLIAEVG